MTTRALIATRSRFLELKGRRRVRHLMCTYPVLLVLSLLAFHH